MAAPLEFLQPSEAARMLGLSLPMVQKLARLGKLPVAAKTPGGWKLFRQQDVEALRKEREQNPPTKGPKPAMKVKGRTNRTK